MLKKHGQVLVTLFFAGDLAVTVISWYSACHIRFGSPGTPMSMALLIAAIWAVVLKGAGLYRSQRSTPLVWEIRRIAYASALATGIFAGAVYFYFGEVYSRAAFVLFFLTDVVLMSLNRAAVRTLLRHFRKKGFNLRHVLIIGAGELGIKVAEKLEENPWMGLNVVGYIDDGLTKGEMVGGREVLGGAKDVKAVIHDKAVDQVFIALPVSAYPSLKSLLDGLTRETVDIRLAPDVFQAMTLNANVEDLGGIPLINVTESRVQGWLWVGKRAIDIVFSLLALSISGPLMLVIAACIKATSKGPVFYRQERMGLNGKAFQMLKFRSMAVGAESRTGAVWAGKDDPRRTSFGAFLRKTSLDEMPQFFNVLKGDMSVVGPRPERPVFIKKFVDEIPGYMLRHKVKAGITGWAQVNGWRGNTSLQKRIEYDLYYIENWSLWFDIKIMFITLLKGFVNESAY